MAGFSELIKSFDKIRDYARDFLIYGYKSRNDFTIKSVRSYDNEKRRIEGYLTGYVKWETNARGKKVFISTDTADISENPLFAMWETKSFTVNDCMLHFYLTDMLKETPGLTAKEAADRLQDSYLFHFADHLMPDAMTVRNKLNEYADAGIYTRQKAGKLLRYYLHSALENSLCPFLPKLLPAIQFFENVLPAGVLGYFIRRDCGKKEAVFSFRHLFMSHTLDDEVLLACATAIASQQLISFQNYRRRSRSQPTASETVLPLKIAVNARHGRRYLLAYNTRLRKFFSYRLDHMKHIKPLEQSVMFNQRLDELDNRLQFTWGVALGKSVQMEQLAVTLHIDEEREIYVLARLTREGKHGTVEKTAADTFVYRIAVTDTMELLPWLRTFIGRIIAIEGSNRQAIKRFTDDLERMFQLYAQ